MVGSVGGMHSNFGRGWPKIRGPRGRSEATVGEDRSLAGVWGPPQENLKMILNLLLEMTSFFLDEAKNCLKNLDFSEEFSIFRLSALL